MHGSPVVLQAPAHWQTVDVISDIHLHPSEPRTHAAWTHYLRHCRADALFILGDLFEVWVGDDVLDHADGFEHRCADSLRALSERTAVYLMHGNRDFLMGPRLAHACGATLLPDPSTLQFGNTRFVLTHGDALCLGDTDYQQFRATVRSDTWQQAFLSRPLGTNTQMLTPQQLCAGCTTPGHKS
jgi:UDP-2,3-diacylglucosamine hydrolase